MKKFFGLFILLISFSASQLLALKPAGNSAEKLIQFHNIVSRQKIAWSDFHKNTIFEIKSLNKQIVREWVNFSNNNIRKLEYLKLDDQSKEAYFKQELDEAIALHKAHTVKWANLMKKQNAAAAKLVSKNRAELESFEGKGESAFEKAKKYFSKKKTLPGQEQASDEEVDELSFETPA